MVAFFLFVPLRNVFVNFAAMILQAHCQRLESLGFSKLERSHIFPEFTTQSLLDYWVLSLVCLHLFVSKFEAVSHPAEVELWVPSEAAFDAFGVCGPP